MLPILARGGGDLSDYILILSGIAAVIAYVVVAFFASLLAGAAEGLAVLWGIMLIVRRRKGPSHWFWRPMLWSIGLAAMPSLGMGLNLAYAIRSADRGSSLTDSLWRQAIPVLIGVPFVLLLLGLGIVYLVRGIRELWKHGSAHASAASGPDYGGAAGSIGKRALAWILVTIGKVLMTVSLFLGRYHGVLVDHRGRYEGCWRYRSRVAPDRSRRTGGRRRGSPLVAGAGRRQPSS